MPIELPPAHRETWRVVGTRTQKSRLGLVSTTSQTTLYEHVPTADALEALDTDGVEIPVRSLFAIDLSIRPSLTSLGVAPGTVLGMAASKAKGQFVESVEGDGLIVEGERESTRFERADGTTGKRYVLETACPVDPALSSDDAEAITAETHVAVWPTETDYGMAGGTLPLEAPAELEADLAVDPERDRKTILEVVRTLEIGSESDDGDES
ncbi:hypothetical protein ACFOZ7_14405 [Natribaculum luteum]|uniref:Uncharacterized protein n=1 Tax=Natribaculum luteum TaxID=1586232 RepID=A0ABD5P1C8_9EURY|nr:hypothetical protein [Natribaculum luteum]